MTVKKSPEAIAAVLGCLLARRLVLLPSLKLGKQTQAALVDASGAAPARRTRVG
jgi:hypothetical protein